MTEANTPSTSGGGEDPLERASEEGPLPGSDYLNEQEQPGEDESRTDDSDRRAEEAGEGDVTGNIALRPE